MHALTQLSARRAWNAETAITGGLVADDLLSIVWNKIAALTGGSQEWPIGLGLRPWYLKVRLPPPRGCMHTHAMTGHAAAAYCKAVLRAARSSAEVIPVVASSSVQ